MTTEKTILALSGSLRAKSFNRAALQACAELTPRGFQIEIASIGALPLYNSDLDSEDGLRPVEQFRKAITEADAVLIATPEYNYGIPGVLKNALDWASRPAYASPFQLKPVAILGATQSSVGTARAQGHLKNVLLGMVAALFPYPEVLIASAHKRFDKNLVLTDEDTRNVLSRMLFAYSKWIDRIQLEPF
ncbi:MAG: NAD(P)H-dependent oxidoreductase [Myxococcota bacterium]